MNALEEYKNEDAIDLLADLIDPVARMLGNKELKEAVESKQPKIVLVQKALKFNKAEVIEILAKCDGCTVEEYNKNAIQIATDFLKVLSNKEIMALFQ